MAQIGCPALMVGSRGPLQVCSSLSLASSTSVAPDLEDSKDIMRPYATYVEYGFESFGRANKRVVKIRRCYRAISSRTSTFRNPSRLWLTLLHFEILARPIADPDTPRMHLQWRWRI